MSFEKESEFNKETEIENLKQEIEILKSENQELKKTIENLKTDLIHDELTGLKSRKYFTEKTKEDILVVSTYESEKRKERFKTISLLFCDIDYFKKINDNYGHFFGDEILKEVAQIIKENIRESDTVCSWGGEEIIVSLLGADEEESYEKAEKLKIAVENGIVQKCGDNPNYSDLKASLSIGVGSFEPGLDFDELMSRADKAMYLAKKQGRNCVRTYSQVLEEEREKTE